LTAVYKFSWRHTCVKFFRMGKIHTRKGTRCDSISTDNFNTDNPAIVSDRLNFDIRIYDRRKTSKKLKRRNLFNFWKKNVKKTQPNRSFLIVPKFIIHQELQFL
jgi:hypothetical protein